MAVAHFSLCRVSNRQKRERKAGWEEEEMKLGSISIHFCYFFFPTSEKEAMPCVEIYQEVPSIQLQKQSKSKPARELLLKSFRVQGLRFSAKAPIVMFKFGGLFTILSIVLSIARLIKKQRFQLSSGTAALIN